MWMEKKAEYLAALPNSWILRGWSLGNFEVESQVSASELDSWIGDSIISKRENTRERSDLPWGHRGERKWLNEFGLTGDWLKCG